MIQEAVPVTDANAGALSAAAAEAVHGAAAGGPSLSEQISHNIIHHISNGSSLEVPFLGEVELPHLHLFGVDLSITRHVVMMWIAGLILLLVFGLAFRKRSLVPKGMVNLLEIGVEFIHDEVAVKTLGLKDAARLTPYLLTLFF